MKKKILLVIIVALILTISHTNAMTPDSNIEGTAPVYMCWAAVDDIDLDIYNLINKVIGEINCLMKE